VDFSLQSCEPSLVPKKKIKLRNDIKTKHLEYTKNKNNCKDTIHRTEILKKRSNFIQFKYEECMRDDHL